MKSLATPKLITKILNLTLSHVVHATVFALALLLLGSLAYAGAYRIAYQEKIFPGIVIGSIDVSGMTPDQAEHAITTAYDAYKQRGVTYTYDTRVVSLPLTISSPTDPDLTYELIELDPQAMVTYAYAQGRTGSILTQLYTPLVAAVSAYTITPELELNEYKLQEIIRENFEKYEQPASNPTISWNTSDVTIIPEHDGTSFDYNSIISETYSRIANLDTQPIALTLVEHKPSVTKSDITPTIQKKLQAFNDLRPIITLRHTEDQVWYYLFSEYKDHLLLDRNEQNAVVLSIDQSWAKIAFEQIKTEINQPAHDAKFMIENGRVVEFQQSQNGVMLDEATTLEVLQQNLANELYTTNITTKADEATVQTEDANTLGIKELIGIGVSDFSGSPANRVHNITVGAGSLHGLLIPPGEEFSLVSALVPIDASSGYLPELVIKGDKTIPEYGGGLCQVGTTAFRAVLDTGLPVTERRNHSYRVRYYEPAGTDATIYDPAPDFKFRNDTPAHILIQTKMEGEKMIFEFWGTSDGRIAETTDPRIYNITSPPPTKYVETTDLEPGQVKCTESAHNGADAELTYTVTYPDGEVAEEVFKSHYRPWQEVCLIGVEELQSEKTPTSTPTEI